VVVLRRTRTARRFEEKLKRRIGPVGLARVRERAEVVAREAGVEVIGLEQVRAAVEELDQELQGGSPVALPLPPHPDPLPQGRGDSSTGSE